MESNPLPVWRRYPAHAAHSSLPEGRISGELIVTEQGFRFRSEREEFYIPLKSATLSLGGASDRIVFVGDSEQSGLTLYTSDLAILRDSVLAAHPELTGSLRTMRNRRMRNWTVFVAACVLVVAFPAGFIFNLDYFASLAVRHVPYSWEEDLGQAAFGQIQVESELMESTEIQPLLNELTAPLIQALGDSPYTFRFYVARDDSINAFALPGGYIVIHSELLLRADTAEEFLGVLAHEIAHVTERHGTRGVIAKGGVWIVFQTLLGDAGAVLTTMATAAPLLLSQRYSRGFETEADEQGFRLLTRAHVDATGMASFFGKIRDEEAAVRKRAEKQSTESSAALPTEIPEFLRSHPLTERRIEHIERLAKGQSGPFVDLQRPFTELRLKVEAFARSKHSANNPVAPSPTSTASEQQ